VKAIAGMRMVLEQPDLKEHTPTPKAMDAKVVIDGTKMNRVTKATRWLAARKAILKQIIEDHVLRLAKASTVTHVPGLCTKPEIVVCCPNSHGSSRNKSTAAVLLC
jgi:hypothetical protein